MVSVKPWDNGWPILTAPSRKGATFLVSSWCVARRPLLAAAPGTTAPTFCGLHTQLLTRGQGPVFSSGVNSQWALQKGVCLRDDRTVGRVKALSILALEPPALPCQADGTYFRGGLDVLSLAGPCHDVSHREAHTCFQGVRGPPHKGRVPGSRCAHWGMPGFCKDGKGVDSLCGHTEQDPVATLTKCHKPRSFNTEISYPRPGSQNPGICRGGSFRGLSPQLVLASSPQVPMGPSLCAGLCS